MKIEVGKFYRTKDGAKVRIYSTDGNQYGAIHGAILTKHGWEQALWDDSGKRVGLIGEDIVSEWTDPLDFDWSLLRPWEIGIAMDMSGMWRIYTDKPEVNEAIWESESGWSFFPPEYAPKNYAGDWKDSWTVKPQ